MVINGKKYIYFFKLMLIKLFLNKEDASIKFLLESAY